MGNKAQNSSSGKKGIGCLGIGLIVLGIFILAIGGIIFFATAQLRKSDEEILKTYQPTAEIADIVEKNALTNKGKAEFYRADPVFVAVEAFIKNCQTIARGVESLACNAPKPGGGPFGGRQIFLLHIDDPRFVDHKYAVAVHEMLHSAYQRLPSDEKKRVNVLIDEELVKHQDDTYLMGVVEIIKKRKKNNALKDVQEELHSKFGVEYSDLSAELEEYYKQYFGDRSKVVGLFKNGGFDSRVRRVGELVYEGQALNSRLTSLRGQLTAYQNAGDTESYNSLVGQFNSMADQYNAKVVESNKIYNEVQEFYDLFNPDYQPAEEKK